MNSHDLTPEQMVVLLALLKGFRCDLGCAGGNITDSGLSTLVERVEYILTTYQEDQQHIAIRRALLDMATLGKITTIPNKDKNLSVKWRKYCQHWVDLANGVTQREILLSPRICGAWSRAIRVAVASA
jgi:hypothetical protein